MRVVYTFPGTQIDNKEFEDFIKPSIGESGSESEFRVHHVATVIDLSYRESAYVYVVLR